MPTIYNLNQPPHPFWDFVANIEDHPFFGAYARPPAYASRDNVDQEQPEQTQQEQTEKAPEEPSRQPTVEDDPDPNEEPPRRYRGIGENPNHKDKSEPENSDREMPFRGRCGRGFRHEGPPGEERRGPHHHHHRGGHFGGPDGFRGRGGHWGRGGHRGPWWAGPPSPPPHGHHPHPHGPPHGGPHGPFGGRRGPPGGPGGFQLPEFLRNLGTQLGVDLSGAAEGITRNNNTNEGVDFEPRADVFDTTSAYIIHTSLPGAKKSDLGVEWDAENSTLRITGVVHRPDADEEMLKALAVNGRGREVGVFEKAIVLGTRANPANIVVEGIKAKMQEGILVITVPKKEFEKTEIHIGSSSPEARPAAVTEQEVDMDSETEKGDDVMELENEKENEKEQEVEAEEKQQEQHELQHEHEHEHEHDHMPDHSDEEGEYVRIDVD